MYIKKSIFIYPSSLLQPPFTDKEFLQALLEDLSIGWSWINRHLHFSVVLSTAQSARSPWQNSPASRARSSASFPDGILKENQPVEKAVSEAIIMSLILMERGWFSQESPALCLMVQILHESWPVPWMNSVRTTTSNAVVPEFWSLFLGEPIWWDLLGLLVPTLHTSRFVIHLWYAQKVAFDWNVYRPKPWMNKKKGIKMWICGLKHLNIHRLEQRQGIMGRAQRKSYNGVNPWV